LIKKRVIQLSLFDEEIIEVEDKDGTRYILRKNPVRAEHQELNRNARIERLVEFVKDKNKYLKNHRKAQVEVAYRKVKEIIEKLKLSSIATIEIEERTIKLIIDAQAKKKEAELDGCYVIKTQASSEVLDTKTAHDRYKDLALVESAFRTMKTSFEEIRPIFVRKETRTRGHVFVVMLAYMGSVSKSVYEIKFFQS